MDSLEDYRRVRFEEYVSAAAFGLGMIFFGYKTFEGFQNNDNTFTTLLCCYVVIGCGTLAESSFEQGRKMSQEVSRLEKELHKV